MRRASSCGRRTRAQVHAWKQGICGLKLSQANDNWVESIQDQSQEFLGTRLCMHEYGFLGRRLREREGRVQSDFSSELDGEESSLFRWG